MHFFIVIQKLARVFDKKFDPREQDDKNKLILD